MKSFLELLYLCCVYQLGELFIHRPSGFSLPSRHLNFCFEFSVNCFAWLRSASCGGKMKVACRNGGRISLSRRHLDIKTGHQQLVGTLRKATVIQFVTRTACVGFCVGAYLHVNVMTFTSAFSSYGMLHKRDISHYYTYYNVICLHRSTYLDIFCSAVRKKCAGSF